MKPTVGRIVHYYPPENDHIARQNWAKFIPAMVVSVHDDDMANLQAFPDGEGGPVHRLSIHPETADPELKENYGYWAWPPRT